VQTVEIAYTLHKNAKYSIETEGGKVVEVEESKVNEFKIRMTNRAGVDFGNILK
jgi:hypothetical protein